MAENKKAVDVLNKDDLIVITGAGGFIGGSLARYFHDQGFTHIRAIDKKQLGEWYQQVPGVESLTMDVSERDNCHRAAEGRPVHIISSCSRTRMSGR
jgi:nucleoside-diphosphate-sugar epimerase